MNGIIVGEQGDNRELFLLRAEVCMARMNIYLPDDLHACVEQRGMRPHTWMPRCSPLRTAGASKQA